MPLPQGLNADTCSTHTMKPVITMLLSWISPCSREMHTSRWQNVVRCVTILRASTHTNGCLASEITAWRCCTQACRPQGGTHTFSSPCSSYSICDRSWFSVSRRSYSLLGIELPSFVPDSFIIFLRTIRKARYCCSSGITTPLRQSGTSYLSWHSQVGGIMRNWKDRRFPRLKLVLKRARATGKTQSM